MKYYSTNHQVEPVELREAVISGLAADNGLFMPERILKFEPSFFDEIEKMDFREIAFAVASKFFGEDIESDRLREIVYETLSFDCPVVPVESGIWSLELFHGPTLAFKDVGARFMARLLRHFLSEQNRMVNVLVATSGDTGSAVANGFLGIDGIRVFVLYPKGRVSEIQEKQFTTLGKNIVALEIDGSFDDCQRLVKTAFLDKELTGEMLLTSANSINVARFLPQSFYYFNAYARLKEMGELNGKELIFSVPSGNFGNITAGLFAKAMGLPAGKFLAANNSNDVVYEYLKTGKYTPRPSVETIANAMDVGAPSNFVRIIDLYKNSYEHVKSDIVGFRYSDGEIRKTIVKVMNKTGYLLDPHGACGYSALKDFMKENQIGVFLETAHPAKFTDTMEKIVGKGNVFMPEKLRAFMKNEKKSTQLSGEYKDFKSFLMRF